MQLCSFKPIILVSQEIIFSVRVDAEMLNTELKQHIRKAIVEILDAGSGNSQIPSSAFAFHRTLG